MLPIVSQSSENLSSATESSGGGGGEGDKKKKQQQPVAPPRKENGNKNNGGLGGIKGSKSSFNLEPSRPSSGRPSSRPSSSRPGRWETMHAQCLKKSKRKNVHISRLGEVLGETTWVIFNYCEAIRNTMCATLLSMLPMGLRVKVEDKSQEGKKKGRKPIVVLKPVLTWLNDQTFGSFSVPPNRKNH